MTTLAQSQCQLLNAHSCADITFDDIKLTVNNSYTVYRTQHHHTGCDNCEVLAPVLHDVRIDTDSLSVHKKICTGCHEFCQLNENYLRQLILP